MSEGSLEWAVEPGSTPSSEPAANPLQQYIDACAELPYELRGATSPVIDVRVPAPRLVVGRPQVAVEPGASNIVEGLGDYGD